MPDNLPDNSPDPLAETTLASERVYEGRIVNLRKDTIQMPDGETATREVVEHSHAVCIVPVDNDGNVLLVCQFRTPVGAPLLEVPAGGIEPGEVSEESVLRELQEEVGQTADNLQHLASFWVAPGWATEYMHAYLATGLRPSKLEGDPDENIHVVPVPLEQAVAMIRSGEIDDGKTIASVLLALPLLGKS